MLKKLIILILIAVVVGVATIPLWTAKRAEWAFKNPDKKLSPSIVKDALLVRKRIHRYEQGRKLAEKAYLYWPNSREVPYFLFNAAFCAEQEKRYRVAVYWYEKYLEECPEHEWHTQAKNSISKLKMLHEIK